VIRPTVDMMEALRLTRQGKLQEAMAVLRGGPAAAPSSRATDKASVIDMVPPSAANAGAWTVAQSAAKSTKAGRRDTASARSVLFDAFDYPKKADDRQAGGIRRHRAPKLAAGATFESRVFTNDAGARTYKLYVPSGYTGQPSPLVVMLHGCTQSPDDFAAGTGMNERAEEQMFLVAYPEQPKSANPSGCWNWFDARDQQRGRGEPSLIAGITRSIMRDFSVERGRVYVTGLSAGGAAAAIMGATYPDLYAAIGVHSGLACGAARDLRTAFAAMRDGGAVKGPASEISRTTVPTIVFHGDRDTTVNPVNGDQVISRAMPQTSLQTNVVRGRATGGIRYVRTIRADDTGRSMLEHWSLEGVGHAWSGGSPNGSYTEPRGPDASREMIRFFFQHSLG
jgi:poly(hydroxyalkanoate) depolymerase family esterase